MSQANGSRQASLEAAADGEQENEVVELDDENETVLQEGDVLANTRTNEKLVVLGYDEEVGSVEYYSNHEREEGLHDPEFIPSCFDAVFRTVGNGEKVIPLISS